LNQTSHVDEGKQTLVIAHRGASAAAPENSLEAFRLAGDMGAHWVELDVHLTADGQLVVIHDATYADGRLAWHTPADDRPEGICLLPEALEVCAAAGLGVNIEIKALPGEPDADSTPELIDRLLALTDGSTAALPIKRDDLLVTSFWPATIDTMVARSSLATGWLTLDTTDPPGTAQRLADQGHSAINPWDPLVSAELVAAAHANGLRVNVWTVNDPVRMVELASWGVDGIITDVPDVAVAALSG
jgi:glycerophosphoryl diester phosphodiesterase